DAGQLLFFGPNGHLAAQQAVEQRKAQHQHQNRNDPPGQAGLVVHRPRRLPSRVGQCFLNRINYTIFPCLFATLFYALLHFCFSFPFFCRPGPAAAPPGPDAAAAAARRPPAAPRQPAGAADRTPPTASPTPRPPARPPYTTASPRWTTPPQ